MSSLIFAEKQENNNICFCCDMHLKGLLKAKSTDDKLMSLLFSLETRACYFIHFSLLETTGWNGNKISEVHMLH